MKTENRPGARLALVTILALVFAVMPASTVSASHCFSWAESWYPGCGHDEEPDPDPEPTDPCAGIGDTDGDGVCDNVDPDIDGDGWDNECDPNDHNSGIKGGDFDGDGKCDEQDKDDDNDRVNDECDPNPKSSDDVEMLVDYAKATVFDAATGKCTGKIGGGAIAIEDGENAVMQAASIPAPLLP